MSGVTIEQLRDLHRPFPSGEVSWRAQTVTKARGEGYAALALAYIDARNVMDVLDHVCGPANWQAEHFDAGNGKLGCRIGIRVDGEWVWKSDGAGDTDVEAEKGAFSSALKRAAVHWGVGRYLYDLGNVWVPCAADPYKDDRGREKLRFKKFNDDPWNHVRNRAAFLPREERKVA